MHVSSTLVLLVPLLLRCTDAAAQLNVPFMECPANQDPIRCTLDFYPSRSVEQGEKRPVLLFWHGGSFQQGSKDAFMPAMKEYALENDVSFATANYPLMGQDAPHMTLMNDIPMAAYMAVKFLRVKADEFGIDTDAVWCSGQSAGATITSWMTVTTQAPKEDRCNAGGMWGPQSTMNFGDWPAIFDVPIEWIGMINPVAVGIHQFTVGIPGFAELSASKEAWDSEVPYLALSTWRKADCDNSSAAAFMSCDINHARRHVDIMKQKCDDIDAECDVFDMGEVTREEKEAEFFSKFIDVMVEKEPIKTNAQLQAWCAKSTENCKTCKGRTIVRGGVSTCKVKGKKIKKCKNFRRNESVCGKIDGCSVEVSRKGKKKACRGKMSF